MAILMLIGVLALIVGALLFLLVYILDPAKKVKDILTEIDEEEKENGL